MTLDLAFGVIVAFGASAIVHEAIHVGVARLLGARVALVWGGLGDGGLVITRYQFVDRAPVRAALVGVAPQLVAVVTVAAVVAVGGVDTLASLWPPWLVFVVGLVAWGGEGDYAPLRRLTGASSGAARRNPHP